MEKCEHWISFTSCVVLILIRDADCPSTVCISHAAMRVIFESIKHQFVWRVLHNTSFVITFEMRLARLHHGARDGRQPFIIVCRNNVRRYCCCLHLLTNSIPDERLQEMSESQTKRQTRKSFLLFFVLTQLRVERTEYVACTFERNNKCNNSECVCSWIVIVSATLCEECVTRHWPRLWMHTFNAIEQHDTHLMQLCGRRRRLYRRHGDGIINLDQPGEPNFDLTG